MPPTLRRRPAPAVVNISSSDEEEEEDEGNGGSDEDEEVLSGASSSAEESSGSVYEIDDEDDDEDGCADDGEEEEEEEEDAEEKDKKMNNNRSKKVSIEEREDGDAYERIIKLLERGEDLGELKLEECREYLRKHKLRISGPKIVCVQRIHEHWRIKDGNAEKVYPVSSFTINCTGDVCKGDVILFKQRVYEKFDIVSRGANMIGKRTIAGRVVKESYGAAKQQHTFTVEILWSRGVKRLPALFPLLVKGRNLYRLKTFRQRWENESERLTVLSEKHRRGAAARHVRAISKAKSFTKGSKRKASSSHLPNSKQMRKVPRASLDNNKNAKKQQSNMRMVNPPRAPEIPPAHPTPLLSPQNACPGQSSHSNHFIPMAPHDLHAVHRSTSLYSFNNHQYPRKDAHHINHAPARQNHVQMAYSSSNYNGPPIARNRSGFAGLPYMDNPSQFGLGGSSFDPYAAEFHQRMAFSSVTRSGERSLNGVRACSSPGCRQFAAHGCVVSSCRTCCWRIRRPCYIHKS